MQLTANVSDRDSLKAIYSLEDFERDSIRNSRAKIDRHFGLLIDAAPDQNGNFHVRAGTHALAHEDLRTGAFFICPYMSNDYASFYLVGGRKGAVLEHGDIFDIDKEGGYERFIDAVVEAVQDIPVVPPMDPNRLKDFQ